MRSEDGRLGEAAEFWVPGPVWAGKTRSRPITSCRALTKALSNALPLELINGCGMAGSKGTPGTPVGGAAPQAPVVRPDPGAGEETTITPAQLLEHWNRKIGEGPANFIIRHARPNCDQDYQDQLIAADFDVSSE